jgi:hypothetical protein
MLLGRGCSSLCGIERDVSKKMVHGVHHSDFGALWGLLGDVVAS